MRTRLLLRPPFDWDQRTLWLEARAGDRIWTMIHERKQGFVLRREGLRYSTGHVTPYSEDDAFLSWYPVAYSERSTLIRRGLCWRRHMHAGDTGDILCREGRGCRVSGISEVAVPCCCCYHHGIATRLDAPMIGVMVASGPIQQEEGGRRDQEPDV